MLRIYLELPSTKGREVELRTLMPDVQQFTAAQTLLMNRTSTRPDTILMVYAKYARQHTKAERVRIENWLRSRTKSKKIKLLVE